jgi:hypothetical protein
MIYGAMSRLMLRTQAGAARGPWPSSAPDLLFAKLPLNAVG